MHYLVDSINNRRRNMGRGYFGVFIGVILLVSWGCGAAIPLDAVILDTKEDSYTIYKPVVGTVEKTPTDQIYLFDAVSTRIKLISCTDRNVAGNAFSDSPASTADGLIITFHSWATNLWPATPLNANVFVKDMARGDVKMIRDHALAPDISSDGRFVVYEYNADPDSTLPAIYRYDTKTGEEVFIDHTSLGNTKGGWYMPNPQISDDGMMITYHTTKRGGVEVWQWLNGETKYIKSGVVVDTSAKTVEPIDDEMVVEK
jgi:hypothetical protein